MVIFGLVHMCLLSLKGYSLTRGGVSVCGIRVINGRAVLHHWCDWATDTHTDLGVWGYFFPPFCMNRVAPLPIAGPCILKQSRSVAITHSKTVIPSTMGTMNGVDRTSPC